MPLDDELVDVGGVERVEGLQTKVIEDERLDPDELAGFGVVAVVEPGAPQSHEEQVGALEADRVAPAAGSVAQCRGHEGLADADGGRG